MQGLVGSRLQSSRIRGYPTSTNDNLLSLVGHVYSNLNDAITARFNDVILARPHDVQRSDSFEKLDPRPNTVWPIQMGQPLCMEFEPSPMLLGVSWFQRRMFQVMKMGVKSHTGPRRRCFGFV